MSLTKVSGDVIQGTINVGVVTASRIDGNVSGDINSTGVSTFSTLKVGTGVTISGGIVTATTFSGNLTGNVSGNVTGNATGLSGTPNITVGAITASSAVISGNVSVAGTITYEDTTNVDSIGVITARSGIVIGTGTSISSPGSNILTLGVSNTERIRINTTGVGIGTTVAEATGSTSNVGGALFLGDNLVIKSSNECGPYIFRDNDNAPDIRLYSTKGTHASRTAKTSGGLIGQIHMHGFDGSGYSEGVQIRAVVDGSVSVGSMPSKLEFQTSSSGSASPTVRMTIDSSGRVTKPYQPSFLAFFSNNNDTTTSANTVFAFDKVDFNIGGHFNTSTNRFTCPVAGIYAFSWAFFFTNSASNTQAMNVAFLVNGSQYTPSDGVTSSDALQMSTIPNSAGGYLSNSATYYIQLSANDYVQLYARGANVRLYQGHSHFSGVLLG